MNNAENVEKTENVENVEKLENVELPEVKQFKPRMTQVKKRGLSEFSVKMGKNQPGGEVTCVWSGETRKFNDINELFAFIEKQCDAVWYPQSQRKLRDWNV